MIKVDLVRLSDNGVQTEGEMYLYRKNKIIFSCKTLELSWKDNERQQSCIPAGNYTISHRKSNKFDYPHFILFPTSPRENILIHAGNYHFQILGCILVGENLIDINGDGEMDVTNSRKTLATIVEFLKNQNITELSIRYRD